MASGYEPGAGGGASNALTEVSGYPLSKIFDLQHPLTPEQIDLLNEALEILFRSLTRGYNDIQTNASTIASIQSQLSSLSLSVSGLSTGGLPGILNQYYYAWTAHFNTATDATNNKQSINATTPTSVGSSGTDTYSWVHGLNSNKVVYVKIGLGIAQTGAYNIGWFPTNTNTNNSAQSGAYPIVMDVFFGTGSLSGAGNHRYWVGLFNQNSRLTMTSDTAPATHYAAVRYSPGTAADTKWTAFTRDGATQSSGSTLGSGSVANNTGYWLRIRSVDGTTWYFSLDGGAESAITTNLPGTTQNLFPHVMVAKDITGASQTVDFHLNRMVLRFGTPVTAT